MKNNTTEVYVSAEEADSIGLRIGEPKGKRKLVVKFPCLIKQVDRNAVEIEMEPGPDPFSESFTKAVLDQLGEMGGEAFLDEQAERLAKAMILKGIR